MGRRQRAVECLLYVVRVAHRLTVLHRSDLWLHADPCDRSLLTLSESPDGCTVPPSEYRKYLRVGSDQKLNLSSAHKRRCDSRGRRPEKFTSRRVLSIPTFLRTRRNCHRAGHEHFNRRRVSLCRVVPLVPAGEPSIRSAAVRECRQRRYCLLDGAVAYIAAPGLLVQLTQSGRPTSTSLASIHSTDGWLPCSAASPGLSAAAGLRRSSLVRCSPIPERTAPTA